MAVVAADDGGGGGDDGEALVEVDTLDWSSVG